jgi:Polyketide cyclase / dehydrase and lipid transport
VGTITVVAEGEVAAPSAEVYGYVADYRQHHPKFLPDGFSGWTVDEGGVGAGTVVRFTATAGGRSRGYRMVVTEPEPGRVLAESDSGSSLVTTYTVAPRGEDASVVRIETTWQGAAGVGGFFEKRFAPVALRRLYNEALVKLDLYARTMAAGGRGSS